MTGCCPRRSAHRPGEPRPLRRRRCVGVVRPAPNDHPVIWHPSPSRTTASAVTRYDDLTAIHMDWETSRPNPGGLARRARRRNSSRFASRCSKPNRRATPSCERLLQRFSARAGQVRGLDPRGRHRRLGPGPAKASSLSSARSAAICRFRFLCSIFTVPQEDAPKLIGGATT